ncbi:MAG: hypothetical protein QXE96_03120 [Candidatus Caldarchaeum sp.]|jgi:hypothetical protein
MPHYIRCIQEETWLTESRSLTTWRALEKLAKQLMPDTVIQLPLKPKTYTREEAVAWTNFFFKVRDYKPKPPVDVSGYYVAPHVIDFEKLATALGTTAEEAAIIVKTLDKTLMLAAAEEALQAVLHSSQFGHSVELVKGRV